MDYRNAEAALSKGYSIPNLIARDHLLKLQEDSDYQKQIRMGDIEFEIDMMDDMLYGQPAIENPNGDVMNQHQLDRLNELDSILGTQPGDVDELGIAALRDWSMNTDPLKYTDPTPYDLFTYDQEGNFVGTSPEGLDQYYGAHFGDRVDLSMREIMRPRSPFTPSMMQAFYEDESGRKVPNPLYDPRELGNRISDVYRHELKHGIVGHPIREYYSHPSIYGTNARFGLSGPMSQESSQAFRDPSRYPQNPFRQEYYESPHSRIPEYSQDAAGDYTREVVADQNKRTFRREPPPERKTHHFDDGGIASLENEEEGWDNLKDVIPWLYPDDIPWYWYLKPTEEEIAV
jgi:hypothetical protein